MSNTMGKADRTGYHQKALAEIRNSLRPYANENGVPSTLSKDAILQQQQLLQQLASAAYEENAEVPQRSDGLNALPRSSASSSASYSGFSATVNRKPSFEYHEYRSDSPGHFNGLVRGTVPPELPPHARPSSSSALSDPPPPPPPPRGPTPPPPPPPPKNSNQIPSNVQQLLKRMSPVPLANGAPLSSARGTSPAPALSQGRMQPMVVQNGPQAHAQLSHQMQALNLYPKQSPLPPTATPPPPYPIGATAPVKLPPAAPPPPYPSAMQNRQSPTPKSPSPFGGRPIQAWPNHQPKIQQQQIILQSVKSTQVQKPVLQTAVAPVAPPHSSSTPPPLPQRAPINASIAAPATPPPPPYSSSGYGSSSSPSPSSATYASLPPPSPLSFPSTPSPAPSSPAPSQLMAPPLLIPTTDPPSYASTIQALAAQRQAATTTPTHALALPPYHASQQPPPPPPYPSSMAINAASMQAELTTPLAQIPLTQIPLASEGRLPPKPVQRRFSPLTADGASSRSDSPMSQCDSAIHHGGPSQSPVSFISSSAPSEATQDSGIGSIHGKNGGGVNGNAGSPTSEEGRDDMPPPPPPPYKLTHQSPIPERKKLSKEREEERRESSVRNYSPQAFKFFMEQHVENLLKSHHQRIERRMQLENEMKKIGLSEEAQSQMRRMLSQKESNYIRLKRAKMDKSMFTKIRAIGVGAFGEVALVRKIDTNHLYAMKTLRKTDVLKRNQVAHVKAERDILAEADNEWVVKLYYSFQDKDNLYFVMDYIPGGDLMSLLIKFGIFEEPLARFYISELVCAVESVHKMGFIHRDIKPDNVLIDRDGHIKLTDFGLCTGFRWTHNSKYYQRNGDHSRQDSFDPGEDWTNECRCNSQGVCPSGPHPVGNPPVLKPLERRRRREHQRCLAHSLVGTPNYIAPEVLLRTGYTQLCDWWSVGVILYEMLVGQPPFMANTPAETQYKVINWPSTLRIPKAANLSAEATDLTLRLCTSPEQRLGRGGAGELKAHPFFAGVDFEGGLRSRPAPYTPKIRYATDTSNFDPIDPDKLRDSVNEDDKLDNSLENGKHPDHAFFEFTFRRFFDDGGHAKMSIDDAENQGPVYV